MRLATLPRIGVAFVCCSPRSARSGLVTGVCTPVHLGRSMTVHEIVVSDDEGRRCSTIRITNLIKDVPLPEELTRPEA